MTTTHTQLLEHLEDFLCYIASEKGLAKNTSEAYDRDLLSFIEHLKAEQIFCFTEVLPSHLIAFLAQMKAKNYAPASISRALMALKVFFQFLKRENIIKTNEALYLEAPKLWQIIPAVLTIQEIGSLLKEPDKQTATGARDLAILELLYSSGLRASELCSLKIYDIDDDYVRILGKGGKERLVPIGRQALVAVDHYLLHYRCLFDSEKQQALFLSRTGKPIDRISVWQIVKKYAKNCGITKNISPHTFRHSFATHLLDNGADLRIIQEMLGHSNISSTERYTHVSKAHLQQAFQACHPRN